LQKIQRACNARIADLNPVSNDHFRFSVADVYVRCKELETTNEDLNKAMLEQVKWDTGLRTTMAVFREHEHELENYKKLVEAALQLGTFIATLIEGGIRGVQEELSRRIAQNETRMKSYLEDFAHTYVPFHVLVRSSEMQFQDKAKTYNLQLKAAHSELAAAGMAESEAEEAQTKIDRFTKHLEEANTKITRYQSIISDKQKAEAAELLNKLDSAYTDPESLSRDLYEKYKARTEDIMKDVFHYNREVQRQWLGRHTIALLPAPVKDDKQPSVASNPAPSSSPAAGTASPTRVAATVVSVSAAANKTPARPH